jgi:hypothetical protein
VKRQFSLIQQIQDLNTPPKTNEEITIETKQETEHKSEE